MKTLQRKLLAILCAVVLLGTLTLNASAAFTDTAGHWAVKEIQACADLGIVDGVGGGRFNPNGTVSNAAMTKMVIQAIYDEDYNQYEVTHRADMKAYFGTNPQWYSYFMYYGRDTGLLDYVDVAISVASSCNAPMNRYNMAQIMYNVVIDKGIYANDAQKSAAQAAIPDFASVPAQYREAVLTCYALGLLTGANGGYFSGSATMTRAQACAVITRLLDAVGEGPIVAPTPTPTTPVNPDPAPIVTPDPVPTVKEITVTGKASTTYICATPSSPAGAVSGTAWFITDNKCGDGYLNNGKPITEDNVIELLNKAETIWTDGMTWTGTAAPTNNNWYISAGRVTSNLTGSYGQDNSGACCGYAAMISDYIFGCSNNPVRRVNSVNDIRPGDIIIEMDNGRVVHWMVAVSVPGGTYGKASNPTKYWAGRVHITHGNASNMVDWPNEYSTPTSPALSHTDWVIYTRYPD